MDFYYKTHKQRSIRKTLLVYGEGKHDRVFLQYLQDLYENSEITSARIRQGNGGCPVDIVALAANALGAFDQRIVVLDNDKTQEEMNAGREKALEKGIFLVENFPCLDAILIRVLNPEKNFRNTGSLWYKKKFEAEYIPRRERLETERYKRFFPKELIEERRKNIKELDKMVGIVEGKSLISN